MTANDRMNMNPMLLIFQTIFLREHNRICAELHQRNPHWDDDRLFETTRLIVLIMWLKVGFETYINGLNGTCYQLSIKAFEKIQQKAFSIAMHRPPLEYELAYVWHGLIPDDITIGNEIKPFDYYFNQPQHFLEHSIDAWVDSLSKQPCGLQTMNNNPAYLLHVDMAKLQLTRDLGMATLNDYRKQLGFSLHQTFADITSNKDIQQKLKNLYHHVDKVEFYPGIYAEQPVTGFKGTVMTAIIGTNALLNLAIHPLLNKHVCNAENLTVYGMELVNNSSLRDIIWRNTKTKPTVVFHTELPI